MGNFLTSSIGKKVIMSLTGFFLIMFLCVHLALNLLLILDNSGELFNIGAHFMATNPLIKIVEPVLALGLVIHMTWALVLTLQNMKARPVGYTKSKQGGNASWASRNMFILGSLIIIFLIIHLYNFWWNIKFPTLGTPLEEVVVDGVAMENAYLMVAELFKHSAAYCLLYVLGAVFLGLHLTHGFWSAFQSVGFSNNIWRKRLEWVGYLFAALITAGFAIIPLYFLAGLAG